ncbi:MAG: hypothetical protein ACPG6B_10380 [Oceanihabitans sp.]
MKHLYLSLVCIFCCFCTFSQESISTDKIKKYTASNKGKYFISWGGNRETYSKSDIRFKGKDYNFTIQDASAKDKPKGWHVDYINPTRMTIPQTNLRIGYFISDKYNVVLGVDHMKYVMKRNKYKNVSGHINLPADDPGSIYNQSFNGNPYFVSEDFLKFEHTNGLNYVFAEFNRFDDISSLLNISNTDTFQINITEGLGAGVLYPKTNTTLLHKERYDEFHVSGYGISVNAAINLTFFKYFYIEGSLKGGYINMPNIRTTSSKADSASQHFFFLQRIISVGGIFRI